MEYQPIIGLEIHLQLNTKSKMFCGCSARIFGKPPNTLTCPVCLGLPGALPVPNRKAVEHTQILGLALNCKLEEFSKFDRKNYFYPDLPKGYQISQYENPLAVNGKLIINDKEIRIRRVHLEEDTGKSIHKKDYTLLDFNKSGVPLVEIVTEPDLKSEEETVGFAREIRRIVRDLNISNADMEKGQLRLEPNISLREMSESGKQKTDTGKRLPNYEGNSLPNYKVELKNINSFKFMRKAIGYEIKRQMEELKKGRKLKQETRGWDEKLGITRSQRIKEEEQDYRYFPEPDIPPMRFKREYFGKLKRKFDEINVEDVDDLINEFSIKRSDANILYKNKNKLEYSRSLVKLGMDPEAAVVLVINRPDFTKSKSPKEFFNLLEKKRKTLIIEKNELKKLVKKVIKEQRKAVEDFKKGKKSALNFLQGKVMEKSKGKADPQITLDILNKELQL